MTKRPNLGALSDRLAAKPAVAPSPAAPDVEEPRKGRRGTQADGRKGVLLRLKPEAWVQLKGMAAEMTLTRGELFSMQSALEESLNDWFRKNGRPPIA